VVGPSGAASRGGARSGRSARSRSKRRRLSGRRSAPQILHSSGAPERPLRRRFQ